VIAPFFLDPEAHWLDDFIEDKTLVFTKILRTRQDPNWHMAKGLTTGLGNWRRHIGQAWRAFRSRPDGIVTSFPHLAMCAGLLKRLGVGRPRIVAYNYNLGAFHGGAKQAVARFAAAGIDRFAVHAPSEVESYAAYLGRAPEAFSFVPLQRGAPAVARAEDTAAPFILAMGSAQRDYATLVKAVEARALPTVIVTRPDIIERLPKAPHLTYKAGLSMDDCMALLARARLSVTPIANQTTASGQITFINAMQLGVPVIATRCPGSDGYIDHERTGLLTAPGDAADLEAAIVRLWEDAAARETLGQAALTEAEARFSDSAAARQLHRLIRELTP
jgi:glycosyltransferase involved in cell wall biosynthesis